MNATTHPESPFNLSAIMRQAHYYYRIGKSPMTERKSLWCQSLSLAWKDARKPVEAPQTPVHDDIDISAMLPFGMSQRSHRIAAAAKRKKYQARGIV